MPLLTVAASLTATKEESMTTVTEDLARKHLRHEILPHRRTRTANEEAAAVGVPREEVAKTVVFVTPRGYVRAVVPASEKVDVGRVRTVLADPAARLATEIELVFGYPMFELGAIPPFGGPHGDRTIVDPELLEREAIVFEAGSQHESVRMRPADVVTLSRAELAPICR
jgi:Ala-tRNA(Pro) deacylase